MSKKVGPRASVVKPITFTLDPNECPFREFRDNELQPEFWGMGPAAYRAFSSFAKGTGPPKLPADYVWHDDQTQPLPRSVRHYLHGWVRAETLAMDRWEAGVVVSEGPAAYRAFSSFAKGTGPPKLPADYVWHDDQTQPLPRSVRHYLHGWVRAETLAMDRWEAGVVVSEEENGGRMIIADIQLSHAQVLLRSSFCRKALSACYMLEKCESVPIEHQWEGFNFAVGPEGWRAKNHIYSPGLKSGGGAQHRPGLSKSGCYLVRLFYLGAWRCVWVSDQVPVDASGAPLLPFSPFLSKLPPGKPLVKGASTIVMASVVILWPLLLCKALLKLAAPDMNSDEKDSSAEDEELQEFDIMHALTGAMHVRYHNMDHQDLWDLMSSVIPVFSWDDDDETQTSTVKSKSTKKTMTKDPSTSKNKLSMASIHIKDTKEYPPYHLPGITPAFETSLLVTMLRDIPLKKPLPEPEVELWKYYRWVDWARSHGMYEAYDCPRTKFVKVNSLLKLSHAPHLLDVQSTQSITTHFIKADHEKTVPGVKDKKEGKSAKESKTTPTPNQTQQSAATKEELREWILYEPIYQLMKTAYILYYPSVLEYTSAGSNPPIRITKGLPNKALDVPVPKSAPLYLQIDGPEENTVRISLNMLHSRVLNNSGIILFDYINPAYLVLECFEWFKDNEIAMPKAFIQTTGYSTVEVDFPPGRHFCRVWVYSRMNWHIMVVSESGLLLGARDHIQCASVRECPWAARFLLTLGNAFNTWIRSARSTHIIPHSAQAMDKEFFRSYYPDLPWEKEVVGYDRAFLHWMFRQALQNHILKRVHPTDYWPVFNLLRNYFRDPDLGFIPKPPPPISVRAIAEADPCDCVLPEVEEVNEEQSFHIEEQEPEEEKVIVDSATMHILLQPPKPPVTSYICALATEEVPCGVLKAEREKVIRKHEAATLLQAHWRGAWARKCISQVVIPSADVLKVLQESTFGNQEGLSNLIKEFFLLYPGAKYAYSVASALGGMYGLHQHTGTTTAAPKSKWIPYFQGVFYCHAPVKVHFDVSSSVIHHSTLAVYDNDTGEKLPQAYNAHITFEFSPNVHGYTVMGHGSLAEASMGYLDVQWQLTVHTSLNDVFHICDNFEGCAELPLSTANMLRIEEIYIPNRNNILGGIHLAVTKHECVRFRAAVTSPDLEIVATLRVISPNGTLEEITTCSGKGEIFWPYVHLEPNEPTVTTPRSQPSLGKIKMPLARTMSKGPKSKPLSGKTTRSAMRLRTDVEPKHYSIEVVCPSGWPLTVAQWKRVDEVRNSPELLKLDSGLKKPSVKEKAAATGTGKSNLKDKQLSPESQFYPQPQPGDAFTELECSTAVGGGIIATRDDERQQLFAKARKSWDENEFGRNKRGADIRKAFREEHMETPPPPVSESVYSAHLEAMFEGFEEEWEKTAPEPEQAHGPTPVSENEGMEMEAEAEEELLYLSMPDVLRDKFVPLDFVPLCTKEIEENYRVLVTPDIAEAARKNRQARIEAALERKRELQEFNEIHVLGRQKLRCQLIENLDVDAAWPNDLQRVLEERDEAIVQETLMRNLSAAKKKQQAKDSGPQDKKGKK